jgi:hypothetical protein
MDLHHQWRLADASRQPRSINLRGKRQQIVWRDEITLVGVLAVSLFASNVAGAETLMMTCTQWLEARQRPDQGASTPEMIDLITKFGARAFVVADSIDVVCRKWPFLLWEPALRIALHLKTP